MKVKIWFHKLIVKNMKKCLFLFFPILSISVLLNVTPQIFAEEKSSTEITKTASEKGNKAIEVLKRLEKEQEKVNTLEVSFYQIRTSGLMLEDIFSEAIFYYKIPDKFRCDYLPPDESINLITGNTAYIYTKEINQVEKYDLTSETEVKKLMSQILIGYGGSVEKLSQDFDIKSFKVDYENDFKPSQSQTEGIDSNSVIEGESPEYAKARKDIIKDIKSLKPEKVGATLVVAPDNRVGTSPIPTLIEGIQLVVKSAVEKPVFQEIKIWIDTNKLEPIKIFLKENEEDKTTIFIKKTIKNKSFEDSLFQPNFPKDAEIIEPQKE